MLETAGAEVYGGAPTTDKGLRLLREVIGELGLRPGSYVPRNGSGLGHANRITADAMADLLRALYLDPRVGPELMQSLSVGGIDGTTRNRFKGIARGAPRARQDGDARGKSCLSGLSATGPTCWRSRSWCRACGSRHASAPCAARRSAASTP